MRRKSYRVFQDAYLATKAGYSSSMVSPSFPVMEDFDQVTLSSICEFIAGSTFPALPTLEITLQWGFGQMVWQELADGSMTTSQTSAGYRTQQRTGLTAARVRLLAQLSGGNEDAEVRFSAEVCFADHD